MKYLIPILILGAGGYYFLMEAKRSHPYPWAKKGPKPSRVPSGPISQKAVIKRLNKTPSGNPMQPRKAL